MEEDARSPNVKGTSLENRSAPRMRAVLKAEARYNNGMMSAPCLVRDISDTGARLELEGDVALPDRFDLYIEKRQKTFRSIVKRRNGRDVGVAFEDVAQPSTDPGMSERLGKLEADVAEMSELLAKIAAALKISS
jgi:PilZ domain